MYLGFYALQCYCKQYKIFTMLLLKVKFGINHILFFWQEGRHLGQCIKNYYEFKQGASTQSLWGKSPIRKASDSVNTVLPQHNLAADFVRGSASSFCTHRICLIAICQSLCHHSGIAFTHPFKNHEKGHVC